MKIAIASSGLGHVARGIETWALDTAQALHEYGIDVTLFAAEDLLATKEHKETQKSTAHQEPRTKNDEPGTHNSEPGTPPCLCASVRDKLPVMVIPCWKRGEERTVRWARHLPNVLWRWGFKTTYGIEQFTFWFHLWRKLNRGRFDILHVQDPLLADWCRRFRKAGLVQTKEILAHGTEEPPEFLKNFDYLQQLAPWHLEQLMDTKEQNK